MRAATKQDEDAYRRCVVEELQRRRSAWEAKGLIPTEAYPTPATHMRPIYYGMPTWADFFSPRQLLAQSNLLGTVDRTLRLPCVRLQYWSFIQPC